MTALARRELARIREVKLTRAVGTGTFIAFGLYNLACCISRWTL